MANGYTTMSQHFNPVDTMLKMQKMKQAELQQQAMQQQLQQQQQEAAKRQKFQQYVGGAPTQQPQAPMGAPNQQQLMVGQKKMASLGKAMSQAQNPASFDGKAVNKLNEMMHRDKDIKEVIKMSGFDDIQYNFDEKTGKAWNQYTKNWSEEELQKIAQQVPGGEALAGLPAGNYTLEYDPINKRMRPVAKSVSMASTGNLLLDKDLTENELFRAAEVGDPQTKELAEKILERKRKYKESLQDSIKGVISGQALKLAAQMTLETGKVPSVGRGGKNRLKILDEASKMAVVGGLEMSDLFAERADLSGTEKSYIKQKVGLEADKKFAIEMYRDLNRTRTALKKIRSNYPRLINMTVRKLRQGIASKKFLGEELVLAQELSGVRNSFARITENLTDSAGDITQSTRDFYNKLIDLDNPLFALDKQLNQMEKSTQERISARETNVSDLKQKMRKITKFKQQKKGKAKTVKRTGTYKGRRVIQYTDGSIDYAD